MLKKLKNLFMKKYLIDTNIFDKILYIKDNNYFLYQELKNKIDNNIVKIYTTLYQRDELNEIANIDRKNNLLTLINELSIEYTGDVGIFDFYFNAIFIDENTYQIYYKILDKFGASNSDARAAVISVLYNSTLVTEDGNGRNKGLIQAFKQAITGFQVLNFKDFSKQELERTISFQCNGKI